MKDFLILHKRVLVEVTNFFPLRGSYPPSILLRGPNLGTATEVLYNGIKCPAFAIDSPTALVAVLPSSQYGEPFKGVQVFSDTSPSGAAVNVSLGISTPLKKVEGIDRLVQTWMLVFLTTPGSSAFDQESGGGGRSLTGGVGSAGGSALVPGLIQAVQRTEAEILRTQSRSGNLPRSERLLISPVESVYYDDRTATVYCQVGIKNYLGELASVSI